MPKAPTKSATATPKKTTAKVTRADELFQSKAQPAQQIDDAAADASSLSPKMISTPAQMFVSDLRDLYWAELHLVKALPKMIDSASGGQLKSALEQHLDATRTQVSRLEEVFALVEKPNLAKKCDALEGLVMSGEHMIENTKTGSDVRDAGIIGSGLKVENFEITCYKSIIQLAEILGYTEAVALLQDNLREEEEASALLQELAIEANSKVPASMS